MGSLVHGGNKKYRDLLRGTMKSLFDAKLHQAMRQRNLFFNLHVC